MAADIDLDHVVYGVPDLLAGVRWFAEVTGVEPVAGGRHPGYGTANYLLGLGSGRYLEIIGPDVVSANVPRRRLFGVSAQLQPRVLTWAVATADIEGRVATARANGYDPGDPMDMSRRGAAGKLRWRLTPDTIESTHGVLPFLIDWGDAAHPSAAELPELELASFALHDPNPSAPRKQLDALGVEVVIDDGPHAAISVVLGTPNGPVELS